jgi:hypothetical protein
VKSKKSTLKSKKKILKGKKIQFLFKLLITYTLTQEQFIPIRFNVLWFFKIQSNSAITNSSRPDIFVHPGFVITGSICVLTWLICLACVFVTTGCSLTTELVITKFHYTLKFGYCIKLIRPNNSACYAFIRLKPNGSGRSTGHSDWLYQLNLCNEMIA